VQQKDKSNLAKSEIAARLYSLGKTTGLTVWPLQLLT